MQRCVVGGTLLLSLFSLKVERLWDCEELRISFGVLPPHLEPEDKLRFDKLAFIFHYHASVFFLWMHQNLFPPMQDLETLKSTLNLMGTQYLLLPSLLFLLPFGQLLQFSITAQTWNVGRGLL